MQLRAIIKLRLSLVIHFSEHENHALPYVRSFAMPNSKSFRFYVIAALHLVLKKWVIMLLYIETERENFPVFPTAPFRLHEFFGWHDFAPVPVVPCWFLLVTMFRKQMLEWTSYIWRRQWISSSDSQTACSGVFGFEQSVHCFCFFFQFLVFLFFLIKPNSVCWLFSFHLRSLDTMNSSCFRTVTEKRAL